MSRRHHPTPSGDGFPSAAAAAAAGDETDGEVDDAAESGSRRKVFKVQSLPFDLLTSISGSSAEDDVNVRPL